MCNRVNLEIGSFAEHVFGLMTILISETLKKILDLNSLKHGTDLKVSFLTSLHIVSVLIVCLQFHEDYLA